MKAELVSKLVSMFQTVASYSNEALDYFYGAMNLLQAYYGVLFDLRLWASDLNFFHLRLPDDS